MGCEQGIKTCRTYRTENLGVKEIPPYNDTYESFNFTIYDGKAYKFAIANQDSQRRANFKFNMTINVTDENGIVVTKVLDQPPEWYELSYYDPSNGTKEDYIFSKVGRSYMLP